MQQTKKYAKKIYKEQNIKAMLYIIPKNKKYVANIKKN